MLWVANMLIEGLAQKLKEGVSKEEAKDASKQPVLRFLLFNFDYSLGVSRCGNYG